MDMAKPETEFPSIETIVPIVMIVKFLFHSLLFAVICSSIKYTYAIIHLKKYKAI